MNKNFWCADPAAAAAALRAQYPRAAERACAIADDVCANRFLFRDHWEMERTNVPVQFGPEEKDIDWALIPAGDPEWIYAMNRHTSFVNLARAWLLTGDERYAQKYARLIEDWIDRVPLTGESRNDTWRSLEAPAAARRLPGCGQQHLPPPFQLGRTAGPRPVFAGRVL